MKRILALLLVLVALAGCGSSCDTLEEYLQNDDEFIQEIESEDENIHAECKNNTLFIKYDMGEMSDTDVTNYMTVFDSMREDIIKEFKSAIKDLEDGTLIDGIKFDVQYVSGDKVLYEIEIVNDEPEEE